jgi:hypothetical protein
MSCADRAELCRVCRVQRGAEERRGVQRCVELFRAVQSCAVLCRAAEPCRRAVLYKLCSVCTVAQMCITIQNRCAHHAVDPVQPWRWQSCAAPCQPSRRYTQSCRAAQRYAGSSRASSVVLSYADPPEPMRATRAALCCAEPVLSCA